MHHTHNLKDLISGGDFKQNNMKVIQRKLFSGLDLGLYHVLRLIKSTIKHIKTHNLYLTKYQKVEPKYNSALGFYIWVKYMPKTIDSYKILKISNYFKGIQFLLNVSQKAKQDIALTSDGNFSSL